MASWSFPPIVDRDLEELAEYISRRNPDRARRFLKAVRAAFRQLADMPELAARWESVHPRLTDLRVWPIRGFGNHLIFYRPLPDGIAVVRVLHGARDIESVLGR